MNPQKVQISPCRLGLLGGGTKQDPEAEEALALADAISTHCADATFPWG